MTATHPNTDSAGQPEPDECWCCGSTQPAQRLVSLGNHPEVHLCLRCAHSVKNWARTIEDSDKTGLAVTVRNSLRRARQAVMDRHLHQNKWIGPPLRWLGRHLP